MDYTAHDYPILPREDPDPHSAEDYLVVVNEEGQHSLWPATLTVPAGESARSPSSDPWRGAGDLGGGRPGTRRRDDSLPAGDSQGGRGLHAAGSIPSQ